MNLAAETISLAASAIRLKASPTERSRVFWLFEGAAWFHSRYHQVSKLTANRKMKVI
jgi:hypothetical protein